LKARYQEVTQKLTFSTKDLIITKVTEKLFAKGAEAILRIEKDNAQADSRRLNDKLANIDRDYSQKC
jgi:uncharacterized membrane-anchored protein YhcB (DUF1043 family)